MLTIFDVANWFLSKEAMTHNKLQKLCYYAYSWFVYANNDDIDNLEYKLFDGKFEAWVHGPTNVDLYEKYKSYSFYKIPKVETNLEHLVDYYEFLEKIWDLYGEFDGDQLEMLSHKETPWQNARKVLDHFENSNNIISDVDMFKEYSYRQ